MRIAHEKWVWGQAFFAWSTSSKVGEFDFGEIYPETCAETPLHFCLSTERGAKHTPKKTPKQACKTHPSDKLPTSGASF